MHQFRKRSSMIADDLLDADGERKRNKLRVGDINNGTHVRLLLFIIYFRRKGRGGYGATTTFMAMAVHGSAWNVKDNRIVHTYNPLFLHHYQGL